jgi:hypothetical protein
VKGSATDEVRLSLRLRTDSSFIGFPEVRGGKESDRG